MQVSEWSIAIGLPTRLMEAYVIHEQKKIKSQDKAMTFDM